jgi:hypothetical protein
MKEVTVLPMSCELCQRREALPDCKLCEGCGDAIVRLVSVCERIRPQHFSAVKRMQQADEPKVMARVFSPWG